MNNKQNKILSSKQIEKSKKGDLKNINKNNRIKDNDSVQDTVIESNSISESINNKS